MRLPVLIPWIFVGLLGCAPSNPAPPTTSPATRPNTPPIHALPWSNNIFTQAKAENKLVLLDLEAVWCHWCHVQDETTYADPTVRRLIAEKYIFVKVDQDSRPDISNRYEDYGWPATVVFDSAGKEIVKRRGYIPPAEMASMLQAVIDDPTPGPSIEAESQVHPAAQAALPADLRDKLSGNLTKFYDPTAAGWYGSLKYIDADVLEYCMLRSLHGDKNFEQMARQTLTANLKLIDPSWGGVYQYSTDSDWDHPHFEKIMSFQSDDLRTYSRSYLQWHDPAYLQAARATNDYLANFLYSPQGAFYTSQDADLIDGQHSADYFKLTDSDRRKQGVPRIDTHIYSRENGWAITAETAFYAATQDADALSRARRAADWIIANRSIDGGGFRHDEHDAAGPYLGDTLAMGRAFLALYAVTADRQYLMRAQSAADFIEKNFASNAGIATAANQTSGLPPLKPDVDENIGVARFGRLLFEYTGDANDEKLAETAMRYVSAPEIADHRRWEVGGILLADHELSSEPVHVTVVGAKIDDRAKALFVVAMKTPVSYKRVEWYDPAEGPLSRAEVQFPPMTIPAGFMCSGTACSSPARDPAVLTEKIARAIAK
jgi:uncharacterized protein